MSKPNFIVCGPNVSVPGETECREAIWSKGRSCKSCGFEPCYRRGWSKRRVDADNAKLVSINLSGFRAIAGPLDAEAALAKRGAGGRDDPYRDNKPYHFASKIRRDGAVSALCYRMPRPINLSRARWTLSKDAVTCVKCCALLSAADSEPDAREEGRDA